MAATLSPPTLVIGLPVYGAGEHLEEALESLLAQTRGDLAVVVTDDAGHPAAQAVIESFHDGRLSYERNPRRLGLTGNWRRAYEVAMARHPDARYFAWGSDHDAWHPRWAERLLAALEADPEAVIAYPLTYRMDRAGGTLQTREWHFDTRGAGSAARRLRRTVRGMSAGNMVYGIVRSEALPRVGVFRYVLLPDRLLLTELSALGHLRQVPERLFYRRVTEVPTLERQRSSFWPDGAPRWSRLPWAAQHVALLAAALARGEGPPELDAGGRAWLVVNHAAATARYGVRAGIGRLYYEKLMRRRSLLEMGLATAGRTARALEQRRFGRPLVAIGWRALDTLGRRRFG